MAFVRSHILIPTDSYSLLAGSKAVYRKFEQELANYALDLEVKVLETGNLGVYDQGVVIVIYPEGVFYSNVTVDNVSRIVEEHLLKGRKVKELLYTGPTVNRVEMDEQCILRDQKRIVLNNCGFIDPTVIDEYIANDGYEALGKAVTEMKPIDVINVIKASGLRGRGGAGFPTGLKWEFTYNTPSDKKYIICNADEGEPGTYKDRLIMEGNPHSVIEGMAIAGYAVGADKGYIYIRGEYTQSIAHIEKALKDAREYGLLGNNIFDSGFSFDIEVRKGAGAYVCGEETALIESIENHRGNPRVKPPYPGVYGLWGKPTIVNNVETLANISHIIRNGAEWFRKIGTENSPGTKVFTLFGHINNAGLIEVPMGITLKEIIEKYGEGIQNGREFKLCQTGGTAGGIITKELWETPMDYDSLAKVGTALGSGALLIMDDTTCVVDISKSFLKFFVHESCGKCTPCREGTFQLYSILKRISQGEGVIEDLDRLIELSETMQKASLCALGQSPVVPLKTAIKYFKEEFEKHIIDKVCPCGVCSMEPVLTEIEE